MSKTFEPEEKIGTDTPWQIDFQNQFLQVRKQIGDDNPLINTIGKLFEQAKKLEEEFQAQTEELTKIKKESEDLKNNLQEESKDFKKKINNELGLWRYFIIGALVVIGVSFVTLTIDTFWKRNSQFDSIRSFCIEQVGELENKVNNQNIEIGNFKNNLGNGFEDIKKCVQNFGVNSKCFK